MCSWSCLTQRKGDRRNGNSIPTICTSDLLIQPVLLALLAPRQSISSARPTTLTVAWPWLWSMSSVLHDGDDSESSPTLHDSHTSSRHLGNEPVRDLFTSCDTPNGQKKHDSKQSQHIDIVSISSKHKSHLRSATVQPVLVTSYNSVTEYANAFGFVSQK